MGVYSLKNDFKVEYLGLDPFAQKLRSKDAGTVQRHWSS